MTRLHGRAEPREYLQHRVYSLLHNSNVYKYEFVFEYRMFQLNRVFWPLGIVFVAVYFDNERGVISHVRKAYKMIRLFAC